MRHEDSEALCAVLSPNRMAPFEATCRGDRDAALRLYAWNIEVSGAFYGMLCCLETALRSAMQAQLEAHFGRRDWWEAARGTLHWADTEKLAKVEAALRRRGLESTPDDILDDLSLGFWVSLLGTGNQYETRLWRPAIRLAFPGYHGPRKPLHRDFDHVRTFRNRIAHHKPVHHRHLAADHDAIVRLAEYISPVLPIWMARNDRVPQVLEGRRDVCRGARATSF